MGTAALRPTSAGQVFLCKQFCMFGTIQKGLATLSRHRSPAGAGPGHRDQRIFAKSFSRREVNPILAGVAALNRHCSPLREASAGVMADEGPRAEPEVGWLKLGPHEVQSV